MHGRHHLLAEVLANGVGLARGARSWNWPRYCDPECEERQRERAQHTLVHQSHVGSSWVLQDAPPGLLMMINIIDCLKLRHGEERA